MNCVNKICTRVHAASLHFLEKNKDKVDRSLLTTAVTLLGLTPTAAFATSGGNVSDEISQGILKGAYNVYTILRNIVLGLCACAIIWAAVKAAIGDQKDMDMLKRTAITVVIVVLIAYMAPVIMEQIGQWFDNYGWQLGGQN